MGRRPVPLKAALDLGVPHPAHILLASPYSRREQTPMPRFAANLSMMFQEHAFLDRFAAAKAAGFEAVEFLFPYAFPADEIAARLRDHGLTQALFNLPPATGTTASAASRRCPAARPSSPPPSRRRSTTPPRSTAASSTAWPASRPPEPTAPPAAPPSWRTCAAPPRPPPPAGHAPGRADQHPRHPGYFLNYQRDGRAIVEEVGSPNLRLQLDLYHCQIMEGDLAAHLREFLPVTGHVQIAGVPERHEPTSAR
jgi:hydroxypyruvate isomerase